MLLYYFKKLPIYRLYAEFCNWLYINSSKVKYKFGYSLNSKSMKLNDITRIKFINRLLHLRITHSLIELAINELSYAH